MNEPLYHFVKGKGWVIGCPPIWVAMANTFDGITVIVECYDKEPGDFTLTGYKSNQENWLRFISQYSLTALQTRGRTTHEVWVKVTPLFVVSS